jgi:hypothetical protein
MNAKLAYVRACSALKLITVIFLTFVALFHSTLSYLKKETLFGPLT